MQSHQKKLKEEIKEQKEELTRLVQTNEVETAIPRMCMDITEKEEAYDLTFEKQRVESVVNEHAEACSPYTSDCPICLETIVFVSFNSMVIFPCCGGGMCFECWDINGYNDLKCCPLCRGNSTDADNFRLSKLRAEKGHPLFQALVGKSYMSGSDGYPKDVKKGLELINLAVEQRHPMALYTMGLLCRESNNSSWDNESFAELLPQSNEKAMHYLKEAADLGLADAMGELANLYWGPKEDTDKDALKNAIRYTTLAYSHSSHKLYRNTQTSFEGMCAYNMGSFFQNIFCGSFVDVLKLSKSQLLYRARHYYEEAAVKGFENAYSPLAKTLLDMTVEDSVFVTGLSFAPRILFWGRKAKKGGGSKSQAIALVEDMENFMKQICANCQKRADVDVEFKRCSRCKSIWYCSKECQVKHWSACHKSDCMLSEHV